MNLCINFDLFTLGTLTDSKTNSHRETARTLTVLLNYSFSGELKQATKEKESAVSVIDNLVAIKIKVEKVEDKINKYTSFIAYMTLNTGIGKNERIILKMSCENPSCNEKWICHEDEGEWSDWQEIGVIDIEDYFLGDGTYVFNLQINISMRKIEKPELCTRMFLDGDFTDFNLKAVNGSVAVHRIVMASHSDVFKAMLTGEWKETIEGQIKVKGTTRECLEHLKAYMYLDILPDEGLCPLLLLALRYMIGNLKTRCIGKLTDGITPENMYELLDFACLHNISELTHEILHSTPSEIVDKAYKLKNAKKSSGPKKLAHLPP